jgi:hypothetical protein
MAKEKSLSDSSSHQGESWDNNIDNNTDKIIDDLNSLQAFTISKLQTFGAPAVFVIMADDENKQLPFTQNHKIGPEIPAAATKSDIASTSATQPSTNIVQPDEEKLNFKQVTFEPEIRIISEQMEDLPLTTTSAKMCSPTTRSGSTAMTWTTSSCLSAISIRHPILKKVSQIIG